MAFSFTSINSSTKITNNIIQELANAANSLSSHMSSSVKTETINDILSRQSIPNSNYLNASEVIEKIYKKISSIEANMPCATNYWNNCGGENASKWYADKASEKSGVLNGNEYSVNTNCYSEDYQYDSSQNNNYDTTNYDGHHNSVRNSNNGSVDGQY